MSKLLTRRQTVGLLAASPLVTHDALAQSALDIRRGGNFTPIKIAVTAFLGDGGQQMTQIVTNQQLIPPPPPSEQAAAAAAATGGAVYEFEPDEGEILADLLPRNLTVQIFRVLLENAASFYGSQMTAMDGATKNAGDMIKRLTLQMNRTRQATITKELIEIISGAEAV